MAAHAERRQDLPWLHRSYVRPGELVVAAKDIAPLVSKSF